MRILLVNNAKETAIGAVEHYRMLMPNEYLMRRHQEFFFESVNNVHYEKYNGVDNETYLKSFDLVMFCRGIDHYGETKTVDKLRKLGIPFGIDFDDYWELPTHHLLYKDYVKHKKPQAMIEAIKSADFITCTTPILAKEISVYNKNVHIIENGIDHEAEEWQPDNLVKERLRFGFYGGSTHFQDVKSCADSVVKVFGDQSLKGKFQIMLVGFNARPDEPSQYVGYERLITNDLKVLDNDPFYQQYLINCVKSDNEQFLEKPYVRIWGTDVARWPYTYHFSDVSLVPLISNKFNSCKSELKLIEAGMKGKTVIVSSVLPYTLLANEKNSFLATEGRDSFYKRIKRAINNPNEVLDKAAQLREDVLSKYTLEKLTVKRKQLYEIYKPITA